MHDPFMTIAKGRYPLSTGISAAKSWTDETGVPRPDKTSYWLRFYSTVLGIFGADHFYLRSPWTGFLKAITVGGFLLWFIWDLCQVWTEMDRIKVYGMSLPFDLMTGIGQGMVYDSRDGTSPAYQQRSPYSLWWMGVLFSFLGIDSLIAGANGRFFRQLIEFLFFALNLRIVLGFNYSIGWLVSVLLTVFFGLMIGGEYLAALQEMTTPPARLVVEGVNINKELEKDINFYVQKLLSYMGMSDEKCKEVEGHLNYGSIPPEYLRKLFAIQHPADIEVEAQAPPDPNKMSSIEAFLLWVSSPLWIVLSLLWWIGQKAWDLLLDLMPWLRIQLEVMPKVMKAASATASSAAVKAPGVVDAMADAMEKEPMEALHMLSGQPSLPSLPSVPFVPPIPTALPTTTQPAAKPAVQKGGAAKADLSTESVIIGVVIAALAGGGALKATIDYLMPQ